MGCDVPEERLWSAIDRGAPELAEHLAACPACRERAERLRAGISAVQTAHLAALRPLPERIGPYRVQRLLGEGGMGIVYEAVQQQTERPVAIKVIRGGVCVDEAHIRLFQREAQTLARLRHPAIASIYEAGLTDDGQHYFAMELVQGVPLTQYVQEQHVPRRQRLELFRRICTAINYAHQRGVIHRDLKPTNILVDADGSPKILDFGLARITDPEGPPSLTLTAEGSIIGTLPYMSPEEARGSREETDVRSDVYALGVVLCELLTGKLPYAVARLPLLEAVRVICEEPPRRLSALDRTLRGDLETIAGKALEKEPGRRYQSAAGLAEDIDRYLSDRPILARRAGLLYQLRKLAVRHKLAFTTAALLVLLISGVRLWVDWAAAQVARSAQTQEELQDLAVANMAREAGAALYSQGSFDRAIIFYRQASEIYARLGREDTYEAARAMLGLGLALIAREEPSVSDYEYAEIRLLRARDFFESRADEMARGYLAETLVALVRVYGEEGLDDPELRAEAQAALRDLPMEVGPPTPADEQEERPARESAKSPATGGEDRPPGTPFGSADEGRGAAAAEPGAPRVSAVAGGG